MTERYELHHGDCLDILRTLPDNSIDAVVTDPPYGLAFMGKKWDYDVPSEDIWRECLRVLKPGGHLLAFAGTRTQHRMAVRIEDAGFEIRDMIAWVYGSGFPKSLDVSKAIDGHVTSGRSDSLALREVNETRPGKATLRTSSTNGHLGIVGSANAGPSVKRDLPATDAAKQWHGWGTALKPALEPITVARKPLIGTVAENVLTWGTGGVNVDGCRVGAGQRPQRVSDRRLDHNAYGPGLGGSRSDGTTTTGRWPANLIHDGSEEATELLGDAARFFYCAKASKRDRDEGCEGLEAKVREAKYGSVQDARPHTGDGYEYHRAPRANTHPTVKPTDLMRYLCRLVTPPGGVVLDPFTGSGSTGKGAILEGFRFVGIEREAEYIDIARARIQHAVDSLPNTLFDNTGE